MSDLESFQAIIETSVSAFMFEVEFMGFMVRPLDFILFTGAIALVIDLFRLIVMRGTNDD